MNGIIVVQVWSSADPNPNGNRSEIEYGAFCSILRLEHLGQPALIAGNLLLFNVFAPIQRFIFAIFHSILVDFCRFF